MNESTGKNSSEETRLKELHRYNILDSPNEREFDDLAKLAAFICKVQYAHIHFLDHDRQWTKSRSGGWVQKDIPRNQSICNYTIQQENHMIVNDLTTDSRFRDFEYVKNDAVRSYAGVILKSSRGYNLGTLCVFDSEPGKLSDKQLEALQILGSAIETQLEIRVKRETLIEQNKNLMSASIFLRNSTDLRIISDPKTHEIEQINKEAEQLLGYASDEITGSILPDLILDDSFKSLYLKWAQSDSKQIFSTEIKLKTKNKKQIWIQLTITEDLNKYFVTGRDITHRKRAEQRFLKQARFTEEMIQNLPGIFFLLDEQGKIKKWNNNLTTVANRSPRQIKNKSYKMIISPDDAQKADEAISQIFEKGFARTELNFVAKNGGITPILLVGFRYRDENKIYATGIGVDITEEKKALKEKNVLLKEIHHRVKNNLAIIHGMLQLEIFKSDNEQLKQVLSESQMRIHSMALIHETLYSSGDFANISFGNYIGRLSELLIDSYRSTSKKIELKLNTEDVKLNINQAIPCALMLNEIITNSLKHAFPERDSGLINIAVKEKSDTIRLTVSDNGVGFDADGIIEKSNTLGMTLIKTLAKQLEGEIEIENRNGTIFKVSFKKKKTKGPSASYIPEDS